MGMLLFSELHQRQRGVGDARLEAAPISIVLEAYAEVADAVHSA